MREHFEHHGEWDADLPRARQMLAALATMVQAYDFDEPQVYTETTGDIPTGLSGMLRLIADELGAIEKDLNDLHESRKEAKIKLKRWDPEVEAEMVENFGAQVAMMQKHYEDMKAEMKEPRGQDAESPQ
ncbi:MAG: hypothetical protein SWQ30_07785 [Thermodesulfobacteriota bacterium]|nr:hypothetical protein [Thermodesulfobacteriota bacterium]